jgi:glutaminase
VLRCRRGSTASAPRGLARRRVGEVADVSRRLLDDLHRFVRKQGCEVALIDPDGLLVRTADGDDVLPTFATVAAAIVWCEDWLIQRHSGRHPSEETYRFRDHPLFTRASARVVDALERSMQPHSYADGESIVAESDTDAGVFVIMGGRVRCSLTTTDGITRHLATLTPGTCFGEVYLVADAPHPLALHADGSVELFELTRDEFAKIGQADPELWAAIVATFMSAFRDDLDRTLRSLAAGRLITR